MKNCIVDWAVDSVNITEDPTKDLAKLQFGKCDDFVQLRFQKNALPTLFQHILDSLRLQLPNAVEAAHLDGAVTPEAREVQKLPDGRVGIVLHLRTDDGMRAMTWGMSPSDALQFADAVKEAAS